MDGYHPENTYLRNPSKSLLTYPRLAVPERYIFTQDSIIGNHRHIHYSSTLWYHMQAQARQCSKFKGGSCLRADPERLFRRDGIGDIGFDMFHISERFPLTFNVLGVGARPFNVTNTQCINLTEPLILGFIVLKRIRTPTHGQSSSSYLDFRRHVCPRKGSRHRCEQHRTRSRH